MSVCALLLTFLPQDRRVSLKYESGGESGFSDYNPFQSGAEETPERHSTKRRKVSCVIRSRFVPLC